MHRSFAAVFARGGTSNGICVLSRNLPPADKWHSILPAAMGSPDPHMRQLNGLGGGISSTSKVCVISPSLRSDADVDYTFVQVGIADGRLDLAGNCGNMSSVIGPVAFDEGLVGSDAVSPDKSTAVVRIFNTNTKKLIHSRFSVTVSDKPRYEHDGDFSIPGVPGTGSLISLNYLNPAGSLTASALPTKAPVNTLRLANNECIRASLVDVSNPAVMVDGAELLGTSTPPTPAEVDANDALKSRLEAIRRAGAAAMGLDPDVQSVPKLTMIWAPDSLSGAENLRCLVLSMGQPHRAIPVTIAMCVGAAARLKGTLPQKLMQGTTDDKSDRDSASILIGHPSGRLRVGAIVKDEEIVSTGLHMTARVLMKGEVFY